MVPSSFQERKECKSSLFTAPSHGFHRMKRRGPFLPISEKKKEEKSAPKTPCKELLTLPIHFLPPQRPFSFWGAEAALENPHTHRSGMGDFGAPSFALTRPQIGPAENLRRLLHAATLKPVAGWPRRPLPAYPSQA